MFDGRESISGAVDQQAEFLLDLSGHQEKVRAYVTRLGRQPIVLGLPWLRRHCPDPGQWHSLTFSSEYCKASCLVRAQGQIPVPTAPCLLPTTKDPVSLAPTAAPRPRLDICVIGAAPFSMLARKPGHELFTVTLEDIDRVLAPRPDLSDAEIKAQMPEHFTQYSDVFSKKLSKILPPRRPYDHQINLLPGHEAGHGHGPLYSMSHEELKVLRSYLLDNLKTEALSPSSAHVSSPVLFVKKPGGALRLCVDYRKLNAITIKDRYPIPLLSETLARLSRAKFFTKIDIIAAFNRLRIAEGDEWKTAFKTRYGLFQYNVLPFGLSNGPASFQRYINDVLNQSLDHFCTAYLDDILVYSDSKKEHREHVCYVLQALRDAGLQADLSKTEFEVSQVKYLGLIISTEGISMDPEKVEAVLNWKAPKKVKEVQAFLGFANFYRRFIDAFSRLASPLTVLTRKDQKFMWTAECEAAFEALKTAFATAPILQRFDPEKSSTVETDSSDYVSAGVLSQPDKDGVLRPVAFFSKKLTAVECNYEIYDKELLAIIRAFEQWRPELEGNGPPVEVLTDHRNLEYYMTTKQLSRRQARWSEFLSRFNFVIKYRPGRLGTKPDALTRRQQDLPAGLSDLRSLYQQQQVLKPYNLSPGVLPIPQLQVAATGLDPSGAPAYTEGEEADTLLSPGKILSRLDELALSDPSVLALRRALAEGSQLCPQVPRVSLSECTLRQDRVYYRDRLFVPDDEELQTSIIRLNHDPPAAGHPGKNNTYRSVSRQYYWPGMSSTISRYIRNCLVCLRGKIPRGLPQGLLKPMSAPQQRWRDLSVDFVVGLPPCEGKNAIATIVDRFTKRRHLVACKDTIDGREFANLYIEHVYRLHGLSDTLVSDRGPQFDSDFWRHVSKTLGITPRMSTAYHPQTDGQSEIANAGMEQYLRLYTSYHQDDWVKYLPLAEFTANNTTSTSTLITPFFADCGFHPRSGVEIIVPSGNTPRQRIEEDAANKYAIELDSVGEFLKTQLLWAQQSQETAANAKRRAAPAYKVGDQVMLTTKNLRSVRPSRKLDWKAVGPFPVIEVISSHAYRLQLPASMSRVHPVFHPVLLQPVPHDPLPGQRSQPPPPIVLNDEEEYEVRQVLDSRYNRRRKRLEYLIQWKGYDQADWEPVENTTNAQEMTNAFHLKYPRKPGPLVASQELRLEGGVLSQSMVCDMLTSRAQRLGGYIHKATHAILA